MIFYILLTPTLHHDQLVFFRSLSFFCICYKTISSTPNTMNVLQATLSPYLKDHVSLLCMDRPRVLWTSWVTRVLLCVLPLTWTRGRMFWKGAACSKSQTSSCDWKKYPQQRVKTLMCAHETDENIYFLLIFIPTEICTRLCSLSRQNSMALPTSLRFWKHTVLSSAYSTMSFSWWWKNSKIPEKIHSLNTQFVTLLHICQAVK